MEGRATLRKLRVGEVYAIPIRRSAARGKRDEEVREGVGTREGEWGLLRRKPHAVRIAKTKKVGDKGATVCCGKKNKSITPEPEDKQKCWDSTEGKKFGTKGTKANRKGT